MIFLADAEIIALVFLPAVSLLVAADHSGRLHWLGLEGRQNRPIF